MLNALSGKLRKSPSCKLDDANPRMRNEGSAEFRQSRGEYIKIASQAVLFREVTVANQAVENDGSQAGLPRVF